MLASFIGICIALFFLFVSPAEAIESVDLFIGVGSVVLITGVLSSIMISILIQKAEKGVTPRVAKALRSQWGFRLANGMILLFPFFSFLAALDFGIPIPLLLAFWIVFLGITIDCFHHLLKGSSMAINPFEAVSLLSYQARSHLEPGDGGNFCLWVDALSETALKAIDRSSTSLCDHTLGELELLFSDFLKRRQIGVNQEQEEELNYTICFFLQRIEQINTKATKRLFEMICSKIVVSLGKIAIAMAHYHPAWVSLPLNSIGKVTNEAQSNNLHEVAVKASITLQQIGKAVLDDDPTLQLPIQDLFFGIIERLETIAQTTFRQDKNVNIELLIQPFHEIKDWFTEQKYKEHPDAGAIVNDLGRVLGEFEALQMVLRTMPNIPGVEEEEELDSNQES